MPVKTYQQAFVSGELSPSMFGREGLDSYGKGAARIREAYVLPQGMVSRREGLQFIDRVTNNQRGRLISFEFNTEQVYLICFTPGEMKVYKDDALAAVMNSSPLSSITGAILEEWNWTQSADTLIVVHKDLQPLKITRSSDTAWTAASIGFSNVPTYDYGSGAEAVISSTRGWVRSIAFKYGRLWLGGLGSRPQTILGSKVGDYYNLDEGTGLDNECIDVTIDDDRVNAIRNLFPGRALQIFTTGGEFTIQGQLDDPVTPGKIPQQLKKATLHGCNLARPVSVDGSTIFVEGNGNVVRQFVYNDVEQSYNAPNISLLAPHLIVSPERTAVRQATPSLPADYVYMVNDDGTMSVLNVLRDEGLLAWSLFTTDGNFEDVAVVGQDVYVLVQRFINGQVVRFIEKFNADHKTDCSIKKTSPVTCLGPSWVTTSNTQTAWNGFDHLTGATVKVIGDDYILNDVVVSNGTVTASESVRELEAGLNFLAELETLPVALSIAGQDYAGEFKRLAWVDIRMLESRGVVVKQKNGQTYRPAWRQFGDNVLDKPAELYTGWKKVYLGGFDQDVQVTITQEDPLEWNILALALGIGV